jgi:hypothetical protein
MTGGKPTRCVWTLEGRRTSREEAIERRGQCRWEELEEKRREGIA